uniref:DUF4200 domain-containing protein n=1 Tax=Cyanoderma ruficeps TaxID=181631 RepID=A0A8C3NV82_9PASS
MGTRRLPGVSPAIHGLPPWAAQAWADALGTLQSHRSFSGGCSAWRSAGSSWPGGKSSTATPCSDLSPSSRCRAGGRGRAGRRVAADPVPSAQAVAARRERALRREGEERARAAAERAEAARLQRELEQLLRHRERLARRLRSLRPFGDYLRDVLARMGQFQDVPAMLVHFGVLAGVRAALAREAEAEQELLAQGRAQLQRHCQDIGAQLLGTRNELARLHARLEAARQEVLQWESCWTHIQSTAIQKTLLLGQIKLAVLNLFQQTTAQLRIPKDTAQDTKAQLDMVLLCMQGLADICATGTHPQHHRGARLLQGQE